MYRIHMLAKSVSSYTSTVEIERKKFQGETKIRLLYIRLILLFYCSQAVLDVRDSSVPPKITHEPITKNISNQ